MLKKLLYILFLFPTLLGAQGNFPLNREWGLNFEKELTNKQSREIIGESFGAGEAEGRRDTLNKNFNTISNFRPIIVPLNHQYKDKSRSLIYRKLKKESLFIVNDTSDKFYLTIDPLFNFEFGKDLADSSGEKLYKNTRGFLVRGDIGKKISFETSFYENQATYVQYIDEYIKSTNDLFPQTSHYSYDVIPGQGRAKKFKTNGYDYAMTSVYVSYSPVKMLKLGLIHSLNNSVQGQRTYSD